METQPRSQKSLSQSVRDAVGKNENAIADITRVFESSLAHISIDINEVRAHTVKRGALLYHLVTLTILEESNDITIIIYDRNALDVTISGTNRTIERLSLE